MQIEKKIVPKNIMVFSTVGTIISLSHWSLVICSHELIKYGENWL